MCAVGEEVEALEEISRFLTECYPIELLRAHQPCCQ